MNVFEILEIEPTQDKKTIKKAYAALVKKYHPEEDMQKWQEIHEAYQNALEWAEGRNYPTKTVAASWGILTDDTDEIFGQQISKLVNETDTLSDEMNASEGMDSKEREEAELNNLFDNLEDLSAASKAEKAQQEKLELQKALTALDQMERYHKLEYEDWKELFSREGYQHAMEQDAFLRRWSEILEKRAIDKKLYRLMDEQLERIVQNKDGNEPTKKMVGMMDPIQLTDLRIRGAYVRHRETKKKRIRIVVFAILILIEAVPFFVYKLKDQKWKMSMQDNVNFEYNLRQGNEEWINDNKKGLNTVSEYDLYMAQVSLDELAKFLMRADEEILSIVMHYTQTLEPGVLALGNEFKLGRALKEDNPEKTGSAGNEYKLVPMSLPFTNRILVGEESVDLPKGTIEFAVRTEKLYDNVLLWIDPKEMGFEKGCEIYCFDGEDYQKACRRVSGDGEQAEIYFYDVLTYQVLCIRVSRVGEEEYPVVLIPVE